MAHSVRDYFEIALRRPRKAEVRDFGEAVRDAEGNSVAFALAVSGERIQRVEYHSTTCMTLVALCEHLRQLLCGMTLQEAAQLTPDDLVALHPEIPECRRDRGALAVSALRMAIASQLTISL